MCSKSQNHGVLGIGKSAIFDLSHLFLTIKSTWVQACKPKRRGLVPTKPFKHHACIFTSANSSRGHSRKSLAWSRKNPHAGTRGGVQQQLSLSGTNVSVDNGTYKPYQKTVEEKMEKVS